MGFIRYLFSLLIITVIHWVLLLCCGVGSEAYSDICSEAWAETNSQPGGAPSAKSATEVSSSLPLGANLAQPTVFILDMDALILPGTAEYLLQNLEEAERAQAKLVILKLNTPGGMLTSSQQMVQALLRSKVPVAVYVSPSGGTATSAGVFITLAGHLAVMAPGTSIGAAHPVNSDGKNIEGDMRAKIENTTIAMVRSIAEQRGRNTGWAEKAVKESSSLTDSEALKEGVIDFNASDISELLTKAAGREVVVAGSKLRLDNYATLPRIERHLSWRQRMVNFLGNPNIVALLWLGATTGLGAELYHPGLIFPGVIGAICLVLALAVSDVVPLTHGGMLLILLGGVLIGAELLIPSGILGLGGVVSLVLGLIYLVDVERAPDVRLALEFLIPTAVGMASFFLFIAYKLIQSRKMPLNTGYEGLIGMEGKAATDINPTGKIFVNGEIWRADLETGSKSITKGATVEVLGQVPGRLTLVVRGVGGA